MKRVNRPRIAEFIVKGQDYFSARLTDGGVRIGLVGGTCYSLPASHPRYAEAVAANTELAIETIHDEITGS